MLVAALAVVPAVGPAFAVTAAVEDDPAWMANFEARAQFFETSIGPVSGPIQKMVTLSGVWPGGGFAVMPATRVDPKAHLYVTVGLSNPDMPAKTRLVGVAGGAGPAGATGASGGAGAANPAGSAPDRATRDRPGRERPAADPPAADAGATAPPAADPPRGELGLATEPTAVEQATVAADPGAAGYGYELAVLAEADEKWPLAFLQWAVDAEIVNDVGLLEQVKAKGSTTIENVRIGTARPVHVVIAPARPPLPAGADLPSGHMILLVATAITTEEVRWSAAHGSAGLVDKLDAAGIGQRSVLDRRAVAP